MARLPRLYAPSTVQYVVQRPIDGRVLFADADDYALFTELLETSAKAHAVAVHAYVLIPTEVRFLVTPSTATSIAQCMQAVGRRYVPHLNRRTSRVGPLWDRRFRSTLIDADEYLLAAMRHVEQAPVVAGFAASASVWHWSSRAHHVGDDRLPFVSDHAHYWSLSDAPFERQAAYRQLVDEPVADDLAVRIAQAVERGWALGGDGFVARLEAVINRRAAPLPRGRKAKPRIDVSPIRRPSQDSAF